MPRYNKREPNFLIDKYSRFDGMNGKHRSSHHHNNYDSSLVSSDLDTTTFLESEDDASSRITATTGVYILISR